MYWVIDFHSFSSLESEVWCYEKFLKCFNGVSFFVAVSFGKKYLLMYSVFRVSGKKDFLIVFFLLVLEFFLLYRMNLIELRDVKYLGCSFLERGLYVNSASLEC